MKKGYPTMFRSLHWTLKAMVSLLLTMGCNAPQPTVEEDGGHPHGAEGGHGHGGGTAVTVWTEDSELFFEYPSLLAGQTSDPWAVHLTRLADFSPITEGTLTLAFRGADGTVYTTVSAAPVRPGIYTPAVALPEPGFYELVMALEGPQFSDRITAGSVRVYATTEDLPHEEKEADGISFLKEQQWPIDFGVTTAIEREIPRTLEVSGEIVPTASGVAEATPPVSGLILRRWNPRIPAPGDRVRAGQTLVVLSPTSQENSFADTKARLERLEREVGRLTRLYEAEAIAEIRLVEARHDLEVAQAAFTAMGSPEGASYNYPVQAPISGVVQARHFNLGARIEVGQTLFEIVDPYEVWLRLKVPARHAAAVAEAVEVVFTVEGSDRLYQTDRLVASGTAIDRETRTLPVQLAIANPDGSLKFGQFVQARLSVGGSLSGVTIPNAAIQTEDGQPAAYVQVGGETFVRRPLRLGSSNGIYTLIEDGVALGEHVVLKGAYQVYLASLSTNEIGDHGHAH
jgi:RND family efflux transporter MFP subunit